MLSFGLGMTLNGMCPSFFPIIYIDLYRFTMDSGRGRLTDGAELCAVAEN